MGEQTGISWTDHTHNPWWGCTKVSAGCDHCYAETFDKRVGGAHWGPHAERRRIGATTLNQVDKWNRDAERAGKRAKVFCASMADVFDNAVPVEWRDELWARIRRTPWLQWQLLTKRPQNIAKMLPLDWGHGFHNVWLGTTVENQVEADRRIPHLLAVPAAVRFLSCEPLLDAVNLRRISTKGEGVLDAMTGCWNTYPLLQSSGQLYIVRKELAPIDWVIVGGESGSGARQMSPQWALDLIDQCREANLPVWFKQTGSVRTDWPGVTGKGDDPEQWPAEFRVQQMPDAAARAVGLRDARGGR